MKTFYKIINGTKVGYINFVINKSVLTILSLYVYPEYRCNGYGTILVKRVIRYSKRLLKIKKIVLDDMSDIQGINNIYYKCGFKYKNMNAGPEMVLRLN